MWHKLLRCASCGETLEYTVGEGGEILAEPCDCALDGYEPFEDREAEIEALKEQVLNSCATNLERIQKGYELNA